jgi:hypothetical protein
MKILSLILFLLFGITFISKAREQIEPIPKPQLMIKSDGQFFFDKNTKLYFELFLESSDFFRDELKTEIQENLRLKLNLNLAAKKPSKNFIYFGSLTVNEFARRYKEVIRENNLLDKEEAYILSIEKNRIAILANNSKGAFYGLMSLFQILQKGSNGKVFVECCTIIDFPLIPMRGISDDFARGQVSTLCNFKKIIRFLSRYKMNVYQPYFEDAIELKSYPDIGTGRGRLTQNEIKELVAYGEKYFVEVIPIFQMLGHWENLLIQPNYYHLADFPGAASLDVTNEKTYEFIENCVKELSKLFPSKYFHAGLDESWDVGLGNSKDLTDEIGIAAVHANHYKRVNEIIKKCGKTMMMYGDIIHNHPEIFDMLPKDIIVVDWRYGTQDYEPYVKKYKEYGIPFYCSPSVSNYNRIFPYIENSILNIRDFTKVSYDYGTIGFINSSWGDNGGENFREFNLFGYAFGAECSWNPINVDVEKFKKKFFKDFFGGEENIFNAIFRMLSDFGLSIHVYELWRHPFLEPKSNPLDQQMSLKVRAELTKSRALSILSLLNSFSKKDLKNLDNIRLMKFAAKQANWFGDKLLFSIKIKNLIDSKNGFLDKSARGEISKLCEDMILRLTELKKEFRQLWLLTNREDNLRLIEKEKYDRQISAWEEMNNELKQETVSYDVRLKSPWIYHPDANPGAKDLPQVSEAVFEKEIIVKDKFISAMLHLMADSFAELYVNDKLIGDVRGRRTLSLWVESQRVKFFDMKDHLKAGVNKIRIVSKNFGKNVSAGTNVQIDLQSSVSRFRIYSDNSWKVSSDGVNFVDAKISPNQLIATEPNFDTMRTSWIER